MRAKLELEALRVEETVRMPRLELPATEWVLSETATVPVLRPGLRPHPTWVKPRSHFWQRVSQLWQFFKK